MISILAASIGLAMIFAMYRSNRTAFIGGFFLLFSLGYRIIDVAYVDVAGPTYAIELEKFVGGNGAAPMFVLTSLLVFIPLWVMCGSAAVIGKDVTSIVPRTEYLRYASRLAAIGAAAALAILYGDMLRIGTIPLFVAMDRLEYSSIAGIFHNPAYSLNFLFSAGLGIFTVLPRLQGGRLSFTFMGFFVALMLYWALTGNRASAFVVTTFYYMMPYAAVVAMTERGLLARHSPTDAWSALVSARVVVPLAAIVGITLLISLLINSYYEVRDYADPGFQIAQRVLVQPVQLWASNWDSVYFLDDRGIVWDAIDQVLLNPDNPNQNTSILYLMEREVGYFRTSELVAIGQQYAGGYPEIFFRLFGTWLGLGLIALFGVVTTSLIRLVLVSLVRGYVASATLAVYVFYGFSLGYIGGMLNFLMVWTFWAKIAALILAYRWEKRQLSPRSARAPDSPAKFASPRVLALR